MLYVPDIVLDIRDTTVKNAERVYSQVKSFIAFLKDHQRGPFLASLSSLIPFHFSAATECFL